MIKIISMKRRSWLARWWSIDHYSVVVHHDDHQRKFNAWASVDRPNLENLSYDVKAKVKSCHPTPNVILKL